MKSPLRARALVALLLAAVAAGLTPPRAGGSEMRAIPRAERDRLAKTLASALATLPTPERGFALVEDGASQEVTDKAAWDSAAGRWLAPATAYAERVYDRPGENAGKPGENAAEPVLEVRLRINEGASLPQDLQSVGGEPALFPLPSALAVEVFTVKLEASSRMMPQTEAEIANSLTVMRIYIGGAELSAYVREILKEGSTAAWAPPPGGKPGAARFIVVELYGGRQTVERLAARVPVERLRRLLHP